MTRKDYKLIAQHVWRTSHRYVDIKDWDTYTPSYMLSDLLKRLCDAFEEDNPRFNRDKFVEACLNGEFDK